MADKPPTVVLPPMRLPDDGEDGSRIPVPPVIDGAPPAPETPTVIGTAPKRVDSLGRSMDKPRGRKPGVPQPRKSADPDLQAKLQAELSKRLPAGEALSDANVGKAIAGAFGAIGIFAGPHWRLMMQEETQWGMAFGPLARLYGPEDLAKWIMVLMVLPVVTSTIGPRIAIQQMIYKGELEKNEGRKALLQIKAMMAAEEGLNIEQQIEEQKAAGVAFMRAQVKAAHEATAELKAQETAATVVPPPVPKPDVDWGDTDPADVKPN